MKAAKRSLGAHPFLYPLPALLVGSYDSRGTANLMTAAWGGVCCSEPLCVTVSIRPERWTYGAVLERKAFTLGVPSTAMAMQVDYCGMASGRRFDKFAVAGLTPVRSEKVDAPYAAECPLVLECSLVRTVELGAHTMFIGAVQDVLADPACLNADGLPDVQALSPLLFDAAGRVYYGCGAETGRAFSMGKPLFKE